MKFTARLGSQYGPSPKWKKSWIAGLSSALTITFISCKPSPETTRADPAPEVPATPLEVEGQAPPAVAVPAPGPSGEMPAPPDGESGERIALSIDGGVGSNPLGLTPMDIPGPEGGPRPKAQSSGVTVSPNLKISGDVPPGLPIPDISALGIGEGYVLEEISVPDLAPGEGPVGPNGEVIDPSTLNLGGVSIPPGGLPMLPTGTPVEGTVSGGAPAAAATPENSAPQPSPGTRPLPPSEAPPLPVIPPTEKKDSE